MATLPGRVPPGQVRRRCAGLAQRNTFSRCRSLAARRRVTSGRRLGVSDSVTPSPSVLAAHLDMESVLLEMKRRRYFRLNETGQAIWRALEAGKSGAAVVAELVAAFDVDEATAAGEVERFLAELARAGLLEAQNGP